MGTFGEEGKIFTRLNKKQGIILTKNGLASSDIRWLHIETPVPGHPSRDECKMIQNKNKKPCPRLRVNTEAVFYVTYTAFTLLTPGRATSRTNNQIHQGKSEAVVL